MFDLVLERAFDKFSRSLGGRTYRDPSWIIPKPFVDQTSTHAIHEGIVKFFNQEKGFGFISREGESDLFFHASNFRVIEVVPEEFTIRFGECEMEYRSVEVPNRPRRRSYRDFYDEMFYSDLLREMDGDDYVTDPPEPQEIPATIHLPKLVKKLPQMPVKGMRVSYAAGIRNGREQAEFWTIQADLEETRRKVHKLSIEHCEDIRAMSVYRLERALTIKGKPVANNVKRCFEASLNYERQKIFEGNNLPYMMERLRYEMLNYRSVHEIEYECSERQPDGSFKKVEMPT